MRKFAILLAACGMAAGTDRACAANLIANGDFEQGATGFASDYSFVAPSAVGARALWDEGSYTIGNDSHSYHQLWAHQADHTTRQGNYLLVNGATKAGLDVWRSDKLTIGPGTYRFTVSTSNPNAGLFANGQPQLSLFAEGLGSSIALGALQDALSAGEWVDNSFTMTITQSLTGKLAIRDASTVAVGNDFGIDDISLTRLSAVPEPLTWAMMIGGLGLVGGMMRAARRSDERFTQRVRGAAL